MPVMVFLLTVIKKKWSISILYLEFKILLAVRL